MRMRNKGIARRAVMIAAGGAMLTALAAGCTPLEDDAATPEKSTTPDAPTSSTVDVSVYPGTSEDGFEGAIKDASVGQCAATESGWIVEGTLTNSADVESSYRVYISLLDGASAATLSLIQVDVPSVPVGETAEWSGSLGAAADGDHSCVLRVERTPGT